VTSSERLASSRVFWMRARQETIAAPPRMLSTLAVMMFTSVA
jgi:hypothetical protein